MSMPVLVILLILLALVVAGLLWWFGRLTWRADKSYFCQSCGGPTRWIANFGMHREGRWRRCLRCGKDSRYDNIV